MFNPFPCAFPPLPVAHFVPLLFISPELFLHFSLLFFVRNFISYLNLSFSLPFLLCSVLFPFSPSPTPCSFTPLAQQHFLSYSFTPFPVQRFILPVCRSVSFLAFQPTPCSTFYHSYTFIPLPAQRLICFIYPSHSLCNVLSLSCTPVSAVTHPTFFITPASHSYSQSSFPSTH